MLHITLLILLLCYSRRVRASLNDPPSPEPERLLLPDRKPVTLTPRAILQARQDAAATSTCGYKTGDPAQSRGAGPGYNCRYDTKNGLWGFCRTDILDVSRCRIQGACVDLHTCNNGCGITGRADIRTISCTSSNNGFCSAALLTRGPDQTYTYLACAPLALTTDHLWASPTAPLAQTSSAAPSSGSRLSISSPSSTSSPSSDGSSSSNAEGSNKPASSKSNTGAIVGGVIGGLVLLCFVGFAVYVLRRLRSLRASRSPASNSSERFEDKHGRALGNHQGEWADQQSQEVHPTELPPDTQGPSEMSMGNRYETAELHGQHRTELNGNANRVTNV